MIRYYGVNDPVAEKLMRRAAAMPKLEPPEDKNVTTLYIGNLSDRVTEDDLRYDYSSLLLAFVRLQCQIQSCFRSLGDQPLVLRV